MNEWGIPSLRADRLATCIPTCTYGGGAILHPATTLVIHRTCALLRARGCILGFFTWDEKLEPLWLQPQRSIARFQHAGVHALIEPDFSLWRDDALIVQIFNTYRTRTLGLLWQNAGLRVMPSLSWSDERSYDFAFVGIPSGAPVVAVECRTASAPEDRHAFFAGLGEGIRRLTP